MGALDSALTPFLYHRAILCGSSAREKSDANVEPDGLHAVAVRLPSPCPGPTEMEGRVFLFASFPPRQSGISRIGMLMLCVFAGHQ